MVRVGPVYYNKFEEDQRFVDVLGEIEITLNQGMVLVDFPNTVDSRGWVIVKIIDIVDHTEIGYLPNLCPVSNIAW